MPNQIEPIDGASLLPLIDRKMTRRPKPIGFEVRRDTDILSAAIIDNEHKLYRGRVVRVKGQKPEGAEGEFLYQLVEDPKEERDLAARSPEIASRLRAQLNEWQRSVERDLAAYPSRSGT